MKEKNRGIFVRIAALLLAGMMLFSVAACGEKTPAAVTTEPTVNDTTEPAVVDTTEPPVTEKKYVAPDLYYDSAEFTILVTAPVSNGVNPFVFADSQLVLDNAVYMRNTAVEEELGVNIETIYEYGSNVGLQRVAQDATTQDGAYDALLLNSYDVAALAHQDYLADLYENDRLDLGMSYWDQAANKQLTINKKLYFTTGDISFNDKEYTFSVMFNKELARDRGIGDLYALVDAGKWTFDAFAEAARKVSEDLNGDDTMDSRDRYGLVLWDDTILPMLAASDIRILTLNDGIPELTLNNEVTIDIVEKYVGLARESCCINFQHMTGGVSWQDMFTGGQALFLLEYFKALPYFRDTKLEYGMLPFPKYNEEQSDYLSGISVWHTSFYALPEFASDAEFSGAVTESLAAHSETLVTPAYYEKTLVGRYVTDEESGAMLDIIFDNRVFDLGLYYKTGSLNSTLIVMLRNKQSDFSSQYAKYANVAKLQLDQLKDKFGIE
ncbi:MAG: extracellular solute-binding protein [Clostridia bacterium]|nr:extracellular solute-binding protein [Clostridia bacterium]